MEHLTKRGYGVGDLLPAVTTGDLAHSISRGTAADDEADEADDDGRGTPRDRGARPGAVDNIDALARMHWDVTLLFME